MKIDCVADLHGHYPELQGGDLLIVAGDLTARHRHEEYTNFGNWLNDTDYKAKIVISGNHDTLYDTSTMINYIYSHGGKYLCDSGTEFEGLKIWGSPWTKRFKGINPHAMAFTVDTEDELAEKWKLIPDDIDILVTHDAAFSYLDKTVDGRNVGSPSLRKWMRETYFNGNRIKLHVHGHIHEGYGIDGDIIIEKRINASHVNERYEPVNKPVRIIL